MPKFKFLYFLSSQTVDIVEIKRLDLAEAPLSEIYKWLIIFKNSGKVWELDFKSMDKIESKEFRTFLEGSLEFDQLVARLTIFNINFELDVLNALDVPPVISDRVNDFLTPKYEKNETFYLRELKPSDVCCFCEWIFDEIVIRYSMTKFHRLKDQAQVRDWFLSILKDPQTFQLGIVDSQSSRLVGYAGIAGLNEIDQNGEYFIFIGEKEAWGKGLATKITKIILSYGFEQLQLHRIFLTASDKNLGAVKAYERAGFKHEGIMRDAFFRNGEYSAKIIMGILQREYEAATLTTSKDYI